MIVFCTLGLAGRATYVIGVWSLLGFTSAHQMRGQHTTYVPSIRVIGSMDRCGRANVVSAFAVDTISVVSPTASARLVRANGGSVSAPSAAFGIARLPSLSLYLPGRGVTRRISGRMATKFAFGALAPVGVFDSIGGSSNAPFVGVGLVSPGRRHSNAIQRTIVSDGVSSSFSEASMRMFVSTNYPRFLRVSGLTAAIRGESGSTERLLGRAADVRPLVGGHVAQTANSGAHLRVAVHGTSTKVRLSVLTNRTGRICSGTCHPGRADAKSADLIESLNPRRSFCCSESVASSSSVVTHGNHTHATVFDLGPHAGIGKRGRATPPCRYQLGTNHRRANMSL